MIGSDAIENVLGSRPAGDKHDLKAYTRALAKAGLHIVLVEPNAKNPLDLRTAAQRRAEDADAQEAAKARGVVAYQKVKARAGVHLATDDPTKLARYLTRAEKQYGVDQVNLGIEVGRSRIMLVDADTKAAVDDFLNAWAAEDESVTTETMPTVSTPGKYDSVTQEWAHRDGGHFYFTVPDGVELPTGGTGAYTPGINTWVAYWADRQLLIPPSTRPEGAYRWNGGVRPIPAFLLRLIQEQTEVRKAKALNRIDNGTEQPIDKWAAQTSWDSILEPDGWVRTGQVDSCGCDTWTAPGPHDNPKSATAHDLGCSHEAYTGYAGHCPLHLWTDNPPEGLADYVRDHNTRTLSKLQYVAWTHHGGSIDAACTAYQIPRAGDISPDAFILDGMEAAAASHTQESSDLWNATNESVAAGADAFLMAAQTNGTTDAADPEANESPTPWFDKHAGGLDKWRHMPPVPSLIEGLIDQKSLVFIAGEPGSGKSFVSLDMCGSLVTGQSWQGYKVTKSRVGYVVGEGWNGFVRRAVAWEQVHATAAFLGSDEDAAFQFVSEPTPTSDTSLWAEMVTWILARQLDVIVFDTWARIATTVDENSATEVSSVLRIFAKLQELTGVTVIVIHHVARDSSHMRGSTALEGAADTILFVSKAKNSDTVFVRTDKQKNHEAADDIELMLKKHEDSAVIASSDGEVRSTFDPFTVAPPEPVTLDEQVQALLDTARILSPNGELGVSRSQLESQVPMSKLSRTPLTAAAKARIVTAALDHAVATGVLEGMPMAAGGTSKTKFIPGS